MLFCPQSKDQFDIAQQNAAHDEKRLKTFPVSTAVFHARIQRVWCAQRSLLLSPVPSWILHPKVPPKPSQMALWRELDGALVLEKSRLATLWVLTIRSIKMHKDLYENAGSYKAKMDKSDPVLETSARIDFQVALLCAETFVCNHWHIQNLAFDEIPVMYILGFSLVGEHSK